MASIHGRVGWVDIFYAHGTVWNFDPHVSHQVVITAVSQLLVVEPTSTAALVDSAVRLVLPPTQLHM